MRIQIRTIKAIITVCISILTFITFFILFVYADIKSYTIQVNAFDDNDDGICDVQHCYFREAINQAVSYRNKDKQNKKIEILFNELQNNNENFIKLKNSLPHIIKDNILIDGSDYYGNKTTIMIDENNKNSDFNCLLIKGNKNIVQNFRFALKSTKAILIYGDFNVIQNNIFTAINAYDSLFTEGVNVIGKQNLIYENSFLGLFIGVKFFKDSKQNTFQKNNCGFLKNEKEQINVFPNIICLQIFDPIEQIIGSVIEEKKNKYFFNGIGIYIKKDFSENINLFIENKFRSDENTLIAINLFSDVMWENEEIFLENQLLNQKIWYEKFMSIDFFAKEINSYLNKNFQNETLNGETKDEKIDTESKISVKPNIIEENLTEESTYISDLININPNIVEEMLLGKKESICFSKSFFKKVFLNRPMSKEVIEDLKINLPQDSDQIDNFLNKNISAEELLFILFESPCTNQLN